MGYKTELNRERNDFKHFFQTHFRKTSLIFYFQFEAFVTLLFEAIVKLVSNYSLSRLLRELKNILHCVIYGLQIKSFKSFRNDFFCLV